MTALEKVDRIKKPNNCLGIRHLQSALLFIGVLCNACMKMNMSLAVVAMTNLKKENTLNWSDSSKNTILSSFTWGYVITLVPAGELAARFGGALLMTISVAASTLFTILLPFIAKYGWEYVCACRVLQGFFQGLMYPAVHNLLRNWVPLDEGRLGAFIYAGGQLGDAIQLMASGYVAEYWGWPAIFYMDGIFGAAWTVAYLLLGSNSPQDSKLISTQERKYIQHSVNHLERKKLKTPWRRLLTSLPVLAVVVSLSGILWSTYILQTQIPTYMENVLNVNISKNGFMSALPYVACFIMTLILGFLFDYAIKKNWITKTMSRKISNSIATFIPSIMVVIMVHMPASDILTDSLLCLAIGFHAGVFTGSSLVKLDIAPNFTGTITGVTHLVANLIGLNAPLATTALVADKTNSRDWQALFYISAAVSTASNIFFLVFGTSEKQSWNDPDDEKYIQSNKNKV